MPLNPIPVIRISQAFDKWKATRDQLHAIKTRLESQDAILTPSEAMIPPETFGQYQRLVVRAMQEEFCRQVLLCEKRHKEKSWYEVIAWWNDEFEVTNDELTPFECNILWDRVVVVSGFGFSQCIMATNVRGSEQITKHIPVDNVETIRGWAVSEQSLS